VPGFAWPKILFEIDMAIDLADTAPRQRFRKFHTDTKYKDGQKLGTKKAARPSGREIRYICAAKPARHLTVRSLGLAMPGHKLTRP
jgi:hypothetical protein